MHVTSAWKHNEFRVRGKQITNSAFSRSSNNELLGTTNYSVRESRFQSNGFTKETNNMHVISAWKHNELLVHGKQKTNNVKGFRNTRFENIMITREF